VCVCVQVQGIEELEAESFVVGCLNLALSLNLKLGAAQSAEHRNSYTRSSSKQRCKYVPQRPKTTDKIKHQQT